MAHAAMQDRPPAQWGGFAPSLLRLHPQNCLILRDRCINPALPHQQRVHDQEAPA